MTGRIENWLIRELQKKRSILKQQNIGKAAVDASFSLLLHSISLPLPPLLNSCSVRGIVDKNILELWTDMSTMKTEIMWIK
jgi:hypothetical protein